MTTTTRERRPSLTKQLADGLQAFFGSGDLTALLLLTGLLLTPPFALAAAEWPLDMDVLLPISLISVFFGYVLSRSQFGELLALVVSITYGFCFVLLTTALSLDSGLGAGVYDVFVRSTTWLVDALTDGINQDELVFTLLVTTLFWFLGYNAAWHTFRIDRIWRVILPPGLILITNSIFYNGDASLELYLLLYLFLALLLVARSNIDAHEWDWYRSGIQFPQHLRQQFLRVGAVLALLTLIIGWSIPSGDLQERLDRFQEFLQSDPLSQITEFWNRLFSPIDADGPTTADYYGGESLELGGAIRLGEQTVFLVEAPPVTRYYWRSRVFDTYDNGRWTPAADTRLTDSNAPFNVIVEDNAARQSVMQEFTIALNGSRIIYTAPQPLQVDLATRSDLFYTQTEGTTNRAMNISVIRPTEVLRRGDTYTATSLISQADANQLRSASTTYPEWVNRLYLYVSPSVTQRTVDLARQIVAEAGAVNPYDQAKAIEGWLRTNIVYNETIPRPPAGQDPVDWVLFDYREGYCNYYASAMIVMLRSLGIPSRMAAGFAEGTYDANQGQYIVSERDAHTWVEAYFPGYGWIEFEPTAAQQPLEREGDNEVSTQPIAPPVITPTPTATPTLPPTATPPATATAPPPDQENLNLPTATPTITPTFTPSPTATPVIVPTQPPPIEPPPQNPVELILPAIGVFLLLLLAVLVLLAIGTFIYWWWEWRGMRGLSPIARAYARLERYVRLIGIYLGTTETPDERRTNIVRRLPQADRPVSAITRMYTTERYGPGDRHPAEGHHKSEVANKAWQTARKSILGRWANRFRFWKRR